MKKLLSLITLLFIGSIAFSQITITSTVTNVSCFGGADGAIALSSSGGTAPYTYSWTPTLPSSPNVSNLSAGTYSVFILDASANTSSLVISIGQPSQLNAIAVAQSSAAC
ncbi:MAG: SprB repeat-containing protein [Bacteroidetes bacterium]|nr:SprB repeat-containing protein [Bacteroidota bacterium]